MDYPVDSRLVAIVDEYVKEGKTYELIMMLYIILDILDQNIRKKVYQARAAWKRKMAAPARKAAKDRIEAFFNAMSTEELIKFQNTPWEELPEWIKEDFSKIVRYPMENNYVRIYGLVDKEQRQHEITGSRIVRYMEKYRFITADEEGTKLDFERFSKVCNELAAKYDLPRIHGKKAQRARVTTSDLKNYVQCRATPKGDKMSILSAATGMPVWWLGGYLKPVVPDIGTSHPLTPAPAVGRYRKGRSKGA